MGDLSIFFFTF